MKKYLAILLTMMLLLSAAWNVSATSVDGNAVENNGTVTISGSVTEQVAGQQVTVLIVEGGTDLNSLAPGNIVYMKQTTPDSNGAYSVSFTMPQAKRTGTYDVYVGATNVGNPDNTSVTFATEAPTATPTTAPTVDMPTAKPAANHSNAFYYVITISVNDGTVTGFNVKHYPTERGESVAASHDFALTNISGVTIKVISALKDIPEGKENVPITTKATLTYTIGGDAGSVEASRETTLNQTKNY